MKTRSTVIVKKGIVASSHELASFWGAETLRKGGNVVDAALTTSAMLCVVQNNLCGLGGDLFALIKCGDSKVRGINGSGRAGHNAKIEFYNSKGYKSEIPKRGPLAAPTVPGIVNAWGEIAKKYASMELKELLAPAIEYAESGFPLTQNYVDSIKATREFLGDVGGWSEIFVPEGKIPLAGTNFRQIELSNTLKSIAQEGTQNYYRGALMEKIVSGIKEQGGILDEEDFARQTSTWDEPIKTNYRGVDIYETAPNSQGATAALWLNMLENNVQKEEDEGDLLKIYLETGLKAYAERTKHIADPTFHPLPAGFETKEYAKRLLEEGEAAPILQNPAAKKSSGDTTFFAVADAEGNCASVIQSNYMGFGSGLVPKGTGFSLHNRGSYFSLDPSHHNSLSPGKRTFHTICASMGERDGKTLFALGLMGGDIQPQIHVQLITKILDGGMDIQAAIDEPRWAFPGTIYETPSTLLVEEELYARTVKELSRRKGKSEDDDGDLFLNGLKVQVLRGYSHLTGHAQGVLFSKDGKSISGGADPRGDGAAVGF